MDPAFVVYVPEGREQVIAVTSEGRIRYFLLMLSLFLNAVEASLVLLEAPQHTDA